MWLAIFSGDNEYVDIILSDTPLGQDDRLIIDIDFRSHFEIARAVDSYQRIMESLPVVYVGTVARLNQFLQAMVDAAKFSLKQNSMPLPPWRSLNYLQSKWLSPYKRHLGPINQEGPGMFSPGLHKQCAENLKRLQFALHAEQEAERFVKKKKKSRERIRIHGAPWEFVQMWLSWGQKNFALFESIFLSVIFVFAAVSCFLYEGFTLVAKIIGFYTKKKIYKITRQVP